MRDEEQILIIGAGFGGLAMGIRLLQEGITSFTILEKGQGVGGTWRDNRYPGAACDVPSHLYSFSFAPRADWSRKFAPQAEILAYLEACADRFGVRRHIRFGAEVVEARFDEEAGLWTVRLGDGQRLRGRVLVSATGGLSRPRLPEIEGLRDFQGPVLHSARWDDQVELDDKVVGVIGTGASAIQVVPSITPRVKRLHLFQRTPPWVVPRRDRAFRLRERLVFKAVPGARWLYRQRLYWGHEVRGVGFVRFPGILRAASAVARTHLKRQVPDPSLRARLTPDYGMGCKRILLSDDYYPAVADGRVELVTDPIERFDARGVQTGDGRHRPLDVLVLCTGFAASEDMAPFPVYGRGGHNLQEAWREGGEAYKGTVVSGYPNLFLLVGPNTGLGHNSMIFVIESQVNYVLDGIRQLRRRHLSWIDVRPEVQRRYNQRLQWRMKRTVWLRGGCSSWYLTRDGRNTTLWPGLTVELYLRTRRLDLARFEVRPEAVADYQVRPVSQAS